MHEVSLMEDTLELAIASAKQQGATKIHRLVLQVGELSGVIPEALAFAFDVVAQNTIAENAKLELETVPVVVHCTGCDRNFHPNDLIYECPHCHQLCTDVKQGKELTLASLEIS